MLDQPMSDVSETTTLNASAARAMKNRLDNPPEIALTEAVRFAGAETGSSTGWVSSFWKCSNGPGKLTPSEFFYYRLYDGHEGTDAAQRYVGKAVQEKMHRACCDPMWFAPALDKLTFLNLMQGAGIPVPDTEAVFDPSGKRMHPRLITCNDGLSALLDRAGSYPLFAKPIDGMYSVGVLAITDGDGDYVHIRGAGKVAVSDVATYMRDVTDAGYLLQNMMLPHVHIHDAFGPTLASVRMLVLLGDDGPKIESTVVKIPMPDNVADNYWRTGNMLGAVDTETGQILRAVTGTGKDLREAGTHPVTGTQLPGFYLPDWRVATEMCKRAAATLPGLKTQSWDIALTRKGPVAMEVNWGGDVNLHQLAHNRGILTPSFVQHLRDNGYKGRLPNG